MVRTQRSSLASHGLRCPGPPRRPFTSTSCPWTLESGQPRADYTTAAGAPQENLMASVHFRRKCSCSPLLKCRPHRRSRYAHGVTGDAWRDPGPTPRVGCHSQRAVIESPRSRINDPGTNARCEEIELEGVPADGLRLYQRLLVRPVLSTDGPLQCPQAESGVHRPLLGGGRALPSGRTGAGASSRQQSSSLACPDVRYSSTGLYLPP